MYQGMYTKYTKIVYPRIEWLHFDREDNSTIENKSCIVVIPVYKSKLSDDEILSIKQGIKILGSSYHICLVGPSSLDYSYYESVFNFKFDILKCNDAYFKSISSYSYLCESPYFYKAFEDYEYMFIYQNDGYIFEDSLESFIKMGYDYIGAPWKAGDFSKNESVGNGGVSLRKIKTFIELCSLLNVDNIKCARYEHLEDLFFCKYINRHIKAFNIAPANIARKFCITWYPSYFIKKDSDMPMCAHAWHKSENYKFWINYIK